MHPFFLRRERLLAYILGWLGFSFLASLAISSEDTGLLPVLALVVPVALMNSFVSLSSWYLCRSLPLRETPNLRLFVSLLSAGIVGGSILLGLTVVWSTILSNLTGSPAEFSGLTLRMVFGAGMTLHLLAIVFHYLLVAFESSRAAERRSLEAEIHARAAELKALRAQIDPHFLFNSLNSVSALISSNPIRAREMTVQLANFFRASVAAGRQHLIPLEKELDLVRNYLDIEKVRHGERLSVDSNVQTEVTTRNVPPLILQPLIENAIKHGIAHLIEGGTVRITAALVGSGVRIEISNPFDPDSDERKQGGTAFGLKAVQDRIEAISPGRGSLATSATKDTYLAVVNLPGDLH